MNDNAFNKKSSIKIKKTSSGKIPDNVGFSRTDGYIMPQEEYFRQLEENGFTIERTPNGIFIYKTTTNDNKKRTPSKKRNPRSK